MKFVSIKLYCNTKLKNLVYIVQTNIFFWFRSRERICGNLCLNCFEVISWLKAPIFFGHYPLSGSNNEKVENECLLFDFQYLFFECLQFQINELHSHSNSIGFDSGHRLTWNDQFHQFSSLGLVVVTISAIAMTETISAVKLYWWVSYTMPVLNETGKLCPEIIVSMFSTA